MRKDQKRQENGSQGNGRATALDCCALETIELLRSSSGI